MYMCTCKWTMEHSLTINVYISIILSHTQAPVKAAHACSTQPYTCTFGKQCFSYFGGGVKRQKRHVVKFNASLIAILGFLRFINKYTTFNASLIAFINFVSFQYSVRTLDSFCLHFQKCLGTNHMYATIAFP